MTRKPHDEAWARRLASGDGEGAWKEFLERHRRLIFATIGRLVPDREEQMDAFALVCEKLREDDFRRLRRFDFDGPALFSTWLVTVIRNLVIDWYRRTRGRSRLDGALVELSEPHRAIFHQLAVRGLSYVEAYESLKAAGGFGGGFGAFLRAVRELYGEVEARAGVLARELIGTDPSFELSDGPVIPDESRIHHREAVAALQSLPPDVRAALLLFVVEDVPAEQVAIIVGWQNRKAVYNRVYRALKQLRLQLEESDEQSAEGGP